MTCTQPDFGIGQRALLVGTADGDVLWDDLGQTGPETLPGWNNRVAEPPSAVSSPMPAAALAAALSATVWPYLPRPTSVPHAAVGAAGRDRVIKGGCGTRAAHG